MQADPVEPDVGEVQIADDHLVAWRLESYAIPRLAAVESCERDVAYASLALATWGCRIDLSDPMQQSSPFVSTAMTSTHTMINNSTEAIQVAGWAAVFYITPLVGAKARAECREEVKYL